MRQDKLQNKIQKELEQDLATAQININEDNIKIINTKLDSLMNHLGLKFEKLEGYRILKNNIPEGGTSQSNK